MVTSASQYCISEQAAQVPLHCLIADYSHCASISTKDRVNYVLHSESCPQHSLFMSYYLCPSHSAIFSHISRFLLLIWPLLCNRVINKTPNLPVYKIRTNPLVLVSQGCWDYKITRKKNVISREHSMKRLRSSTYRSTIPYRKILVARNFQIQRGKRILKLIHSRILSLW